MANLHKDLQQLWARNTSLVHGKPLDYPMKSLNDDQVASTEQARREETPRNHDDDDSIPMDDDDDIPLPDDDNVPMSPPDDYPAPSPPGSVVMDDEEPMISFEHSNAAVLVEDGNNDDAAWHKHTQTVYDTLQAQKNKMPMEFDEMCKGVNRRTAAGVFLELLQLKTWDYVDLEQGRAFGTIVISEGPKWGTK